MLEYVPVRFSLYRPLKPHLRWTLQCLVAFADRSGRCWPSVRKLAEVTGIGKSSVSRHLAALEREGIVSRSRKPGGVYTYRVDARFLPAHRATCPTNVRTNSVQNENVRTLGGLSHRRAHAVPPTPTKEYPAKNISDSAMPDDRAQWQARLRSWRQSGFWLAAWGNRPDECGCLAPAHLLAGIMAAKAERAPYCPS